MTQERAVLFGLKPIECAASVRRWRHAAVHSMGRVFGRQRLPPKARLALCRYPWFDLSRSIADWNLGHAERQVALSRNLIETLEQNYQWFADEWF